MHQTSKSGPVATDRLMKKMPKETDSFRLAGQRSITSSLNSSSSLRNATKNGRAVKDGNISLSDFLAKRLHKSTVLPETYKDNGKLSSFLASREKFCGPLQNGNKKVNDAVQENCFLDKSIFDKFKPAVNNSNEERISLPIDDKAEDSVKVELAADLQESKKRGASFDYGSEQVPAKRQVIVLGDDARPSSSTKKLPFVKSEQSVSHFNHYANGKGWWDSNMEGVDNEEVGSSEVWEGVGSTTIGGLDWN